jgi:DNA-directed RNA polymerase III subunit RPC6
MSVKFPNRKMYLLKHLKPSEDVAGGPWQSEGEFDTALIEEVAKIVEMLIQKDTCIVVPAGYNNYHPDRATTIAKKKAQVQSGDIEDAGLAVKPFRPSMDRPRTVLRHQPTYPTAASLRDMIMELGVIKDKDIQESDMEQLLEMMVLEGRLEKISRTNYRLVLRPQDVEYEGLNGFVDAPCGTCPVFDLCGDSGEISARTCVYFTEWLATE